MLYQIILLPHIQVQEKEVGMTSSDIKAGAKAFKKILFNSFFHSVFIESSYSLPPWLEIPSSDSQLSLCSFDFSDVDVYEVLAGLDTTKAVGIDGIGPNLLKSCALALCEPLYMPSLSDKPKPASNSIRVVDSQYYTCPQIW